VFIVEFQRGGETVHEESFLGNDVDGVLKAALRDLPKLIVEHGPLDAIRIEDFISNTVTVHKLEAGDANRT
jgi:hypothetical protein